MKCSCCKAELTDANASRRITGKYAGKFLDRCKPCASVYGRVYYAKNSSSIKAGLKKRRAMFGMLKTERGCYDCGALLPAEALQWDHVRGEKLFEISNTQREIESLVDEIAKCDCVCANCHFIRTKQRRQK